MFGLPKFGQPVKPQQLCRIDRLHASAFLLGFVSSCSPTLLAEYDHKRVRVAFEPPQATGSQVNFTAQSRFCRTRIRFKG